jgi:hypothetical protein
MFLRSRRARYKLDQRRGCGREPSRASGACWPLVVQTTQGYIHLAGVEFPEETKKRSESLWAGTKLRYKVDPDPVAGDGGTPADLAQRSGTGVEPA